MADEGWTHTESPPLRYHHFFASLFGPSDVISQLENKLQECNKTFVHSHINEIKWSRLNAKFFADYKMLIDTFFDFWEKNDELKYRQLFMDKKYEYIGDGNPKDMLFMVYYQFIKHSFGFDSEYFKTLNIDTLLFKLDNYTDAPRKQTLSDYVRNFYRNFNVKIKFIDSKTSAVHQIIDILMGAAGYYGNFKCCRKSDIKPQDVCKLKFAKYIHKRMTTIQFKDRGSLLFHWFENTGDVTGASYDNRHLYKIVIWKFIPNEHRVNLVWEHSKNQEIKRLKQRKKYWLSKSSDNCNMFD